MSKNFDKHFQIKNAYLLFFCNFFKSLISLKLYKYFLKRVLSAFFENIYNTTGYDS